jgi:hypothetical protein
MAKFERIAKKVYEGCAISFETLCDIPCRELHKVDCPAHYRFTYDKPRGGYGQRGKTKKKLILRELR